MGQVKARRLSQGEMAQKAEALFNMVEAHARGGLRCPGMFSLAVSLGVSTDTVATLFNRLRDEKRIAWHIETNRDTGRLRVVTILKSGLTTQRASSMAIRRQREQADILSNAKNVLRRTGAYVWDATVDGGPRGFIKVDGELVKAADVIARAAAIELQRQQKRMH